MSDIPEELNKNVARKLHERGIEYTPEQIASIRSNAFTKIREEMRSKGYEVPESDLELLDWMKREGL